MTDTAQEQFDALVAVATVWLSAEAWTPEELEAAAKIEAARRRDSGVAEAAISQAFATVAPDLAAEWNE